MSSRFEAPASAQIIAVLVALCQRRAWSVVVAAIIMTGAAATYTASNIGINTNTADMLAEHLNWRRAYTDYSAAFPFMSDNIVVVVDAATPDLADEAATELAAMLVADSDNFAAVFFPQAGTFLRQQQLLYASTGDLERLADRLNGAQALLGQLSAAPGLAGLLELLTKIYQHPEQAAGVDVARFVAVIATQINAALGGDPPPMSWQRLLFDDTDTTPARMVFSVNPKLDFSAVLPGKSAITALRDAIANLGYDNSPAIQVRLTGAAALADDELASVIRGAGQAGGLAFLMVALALIVGLRSFSLVAATLLTLIVGLVFTAGFAAVAVGTLNMISVAFAVLYVGLGVDFAVHLCLRYRELCADHNKSEALNKAANHVGSSLVLCAITTAIAFFAFIPTDYRGVAELGLISGVGMIIGLICSLTVLPAVLECLPAPRPAAPPTRLATSAPDHSRFDARIVRVALIVGVLASMCLPFATFDLNPLHLNDPQAESITTLADLADDGEDPLHTISVLVTDYTEAMALKQRLSELDTVRAVRLADDLVPTDQSTKLAILDDLRWALGEDLTAGAATPERHGEIVGLLQSLRAAIDTSAEAQPQQVALKSAVERFIDDLSAANEGQASALTARVEYTLMHHFLPQLERLNNALDAEAFELNDVPASLTSHWIANDGRYRLEIRPRAALNSNASLTQFVDSVRTVAGDGITDTPVINLAASRAVTAAFYQALVSAACVISLLLWFLLRRWLEVAIVLAPLLLAGMLTTASMVMLNLSFNFANIIALPLLLGIGVDSALHMLHRYKTMGDDRRALRQTSTARAVLFSALTTVASFGNLALSPHAGTASMGVMLSIGLGMTLLCTLLILPALLQRYVWTTN